MTASNDVRLDGAWPGALLAVPRWARVCLGVIWAIICLLALAAISLEAGAWRMEMRIAGPFAAETSPPQHSLVVTVPDDGGSSWWWQPLVGNSVEKGAQSKLRLRIDGRDIWPPHEDRALIRQGKSSGYNHWGGVLVFSLPPGVSNGPETVITLWYKVKLRLSVTVAMLALSIALGTVVFFPRLRAWEPRIQRVVAAWGPLVYPLPAVAMTGFCMIGLLGAAVFVCVSLYAWTQGWALPTTAPIRFGWGEWAARNEPYLGYLILTLAVLGALTTWSSQWSRQFDVAAPYESRLIRLFHWSGFPIAAAAFLLGTSAMWSAMVRPGDPVWANLGGLVPYSDAHGHLEAAYYEANNGNWTIFAMRRPLAAAFRSVLLLVSGYSFPAMLALQACLVGFATFFASNGMIVRRGIWAGLAFFALAYIYARIFVPTSLTEPLGLFWALLSVPFFLESFRSRSVKPALVGFAMTLLALMTRMGSMFTIPALLLWLIWQFGRGAAAKARIAGVAIGIIAAVVGLNSLLSKVYGTNGAETGSNFSFVLCGLSIGTTWDGCATQLKARGEPLDGDEATQARRLYALAWENIKAHPNVIIHRLVAGSREFVVGFPNVIWRGYGGAVDYPIWLFGNVLTLISLVGLLYFALRGMGRVEGMFWILFWASIIVSSAVVYFDDGARTLAASQPLIALFFATGLSRRNEEAGEVAPGPPSWRSGAVVVIAAVALYASVPWISYRIFTSIGPQANQVRVRPDEAYVAGGRHLSGFVVVADGEPLPTDTPTMHFSDFKTIVVRSGIEQSMVLLPPAGPGLPFGFVFAPRIDLGIRTSGSVFVVPADVVQRSSVAAWHFEITKNQSGPLDRPYVMQAEPWPAKSQP